MEGVIGMNEKMLSRKEKKSKVNLEEWQPLEAIKSTGLWTLREGAYAKVV